MQLGCQQTCQPRTSASAPVHCKEDLYVCKYVRINRGVDVISDHHLLVTRLQQTAAEELNRGVKQTSV
ncbi:hypothetical protein DPMN_172358 [Dreissena polymorpha]|uniref:Uncharacterized protein n=1 Tax=Dreissena polymorpha TaxID=45954 RepID=A0A9D4E1G7_DREPO|nr:hypothetical protein DPMN_172358 [Dreissena polymorpha]